MVAVTSTMLPLGEPPRVLRRVQPGGCTADFADAPALIVVFLCIHCPYARHISRELAGVTHEWRPWTQGTTGVGGQPALIFTPAWTSRNGHQDSHEGWPALHRTQESAATRYA